MSRILRFPDLASLEKVQRRLRGEPALSASTPTPAAPSPSTGKTPDYWPMALYAQMQGSPIAFPEPELEYLFASPRKWRFDLAWPELRRAVEVDGAVHRIKSRFLGDLEKNQAATLAGWLVLRVAPRQVKSGEALGLVAAFLKGASL